MIESHAMRFKVQWLLHIDNDEQFDRFLDFIQKGKDRPFSQTSLFRPLKMDYIETSPTSSICVYKTLMSHNGSIFVVDNTIATPSKSEIDFRAAGSWSILHTLGGDLAYAAFLALLIYLLFPFVAHLLPEKFGDALVGAFMWLIAKLQVPANTSSLTQSEIREQAFSFVQNILYLVTIVVILFNLVLKIFKSTSNSKGAAEKMAAWLGKTEQELRRPRAAY